MSSMPTEESGTKCRLSDCCLCLSASLSSLRKDNRLVDFWRRRNVQAPEVISLPGNPVNVIGDPQEDVIIERFAEIKKPVNDPYSYRYIELCNGVKILLASNPKATTSGAALDIRVGSFHDPVHLQGLCHLCEHVLFTGSEKFPGESYSTFLSERGGSSNAFTSSEHTNFHFEIPSDHFTDALLRFAAFFECPIFRQSCVQNELEMVNSEHEKNRLNDVWRTNQVERATADPNHAFSRFSTGSRQTLEISHSSDRNLRYEVFTFYKTHYSGNLMTVCLMHNCSLDEMENLAKGGFANVRNKNIPERIWPSRPFKNSQMRIKIFVVPAKDVRHLNLTFPIEDLCMFYSAAPDGFVAQLVGHKGPGGLFSHLRKEGLAHHLVAAPKVLARGCAFFIITVQLTESGERQVDDVILKVFQYLKLLRNSISSLRWFFDELQYLSNQQFQNKDLEQVQTYASSISGWLHLYPPEDVLIGSFVYSEWKPDLIDRVFHFLVPDNLRVTILTKKAKYFATQVEPHHGTDYHVEKISKDVLLNWRNCSMSDQLGLPEQNELIDKENILNNLLPEVVDQTLIPKISKQPELFLLLNRVRIKAWHLRDATFMLPKSFLYLKFSSGCVSNTPKEAELTHILVLMIQDSLTEYSYNGQLAGIFYSLLATKYGMELQVRGYSGKQDLFLRKVVSAIFSTNFDRVRFEQVYDIHLKALSSWEIEPLKNQVKYFLSHILCERTYTKAERLKALKEIKFEDLEPFAQHFFLDHSTECFFYGHLTLEKVDLLSNIVMEERTKFLETWAEKENVKINTNPYLEEWFLTDPVERISSLENGLKNRFNRLNSVDQYSCSEGSTVDEKTKLLNDIDNFNNLEKPNVICDEMSVTFDKGLQNCYIDIGDKQLISDYNQHLDNQSNSKPDPNQNIESTKTQSSENSIKIGTTANRNSVCKAQPVEEPDIISKDFLERRVVAPKSLFIIPNEVQSASCVQFYFDCSDTKPSLLQLFLHIVRVPLVDYIKQVMALGYVVQCDIRQTGSNPGLRIIVQSQYPLEVVHSTIESAIQSVESSISSLTPEAFLLSQQALAINKVERETGRMKDVANLLWLEVAESNYNFTKTQTELDEIEQFTQDDVLDFYQNFVSLNGLHKKLVVISIGPDAILNRLESETIQHWTLGDLPEFREVATLRRDRVPDDKMDLWFQSVFDSKDSNYPPPPSKTYI